MKLKWTDSQALALDLIEQHPDVDPKQINFVDLRQWILALEAFDENPDYCGERVLEAVQMAWMAEVE
jgi:FeS assembly protein IscX